MIQTQRDPKPILRDYLAHERSPIDRLLLCRDLERTGRYTAAAGSAHLRFTPIPRLTCDAWQKVIDEMVSDGTLMNEDGKVVVSRESVSDTAEESNQRRLF